MVVIPSANPIVQRSKYGHTSGSNPICLAFLRSIQKARIDDKFPKSEVRLCAI